MALKRILLLFFPVILFVLPMMLADGAHAQATRTWVSGVGDDVNPCSRTAPCKTFAGAISKTASGGEISVLDPGGYGTVTITKSISLVNDGSGEAGLLASGTNGIIVNGAGVVVYLRGLSIDGAPPNIPGLNGIKFVNGASLTIDRCIIKNFTGAAPDGYGVQFSPSTDAQLFISDTTIVNNGPAAAGGGILLQAVGTGSVNAVVNRVQLTNNSVGIKADGTGSTNFMNISVRDSVIAGSSVNGIRVFSPAGGSAVKAAVEGSSIVGNAGSGLSVDGATGGGAGSAILRVGGSSITSNGIGASVANAGILRSFKDNEIAGNATDGTPITAFPGPGGTPLQ
jgi:hypothetical protein